MQVTPLPHWDRQKLTVLERTHLDFSRYTYLVFYIFFSAAVIYTPCWIIVKLFPIGNMLDLFAFLLALLWLSAVVLVLSFPFVMLATVIERYFSRRIARASRL